MRLKCVGNRVSAPDPYSMFRGSELLSGFEGGGKKEKSGGGNGVMTDRKGREGSGARDGHVLAVRKGIGNLRGMSHIRVLPP